MHKVYVVAGQNVKKCLNEFYFSCQLILGKREGGSLSHHIYVRCLFILIFFFFYSTFSSLFIAQFFVLLCFYFQLCDDASNRLNLESHEKVNGLTLLFIGISN